ncbi:MAG: hypothetical protein IJ158_09805 [Treponema sp.]|nr:hypothetical protein [Treponema sp.]
MIDRTLTFFPSSLTKRESAIIASTLKSGIETDDKIEAATTGPESPFEIDIARESPIIA